MLSIPRTLLIWAVLAEPCCISAEWRNINLTQMCCRLPGSHPEKVFHLLLAYLILKLYYHTLIHSPQIPAIWKNMVYNTKAFLKKSTMLFTLYTVECVVHRVKAATETVSIFILVHFMNSRSVCTHPPAACMCCKPTTGPVSRLQRCLLTNSPTTTVPERGEESH